MSDKNTVVIYHANCLDGFGAAYAAWTRLGDTADYIPANYGNPPPDVAGKDVCIVDFSYPAETLITMHASARTLLVLDHHKTAQADLAGLPFAKFDMSKAGCQLAWEHFQPTLPLPLELYHVADRDLWQFKHPDTRAFCFGLRTLPFDFMAWHKVHSEPEEYDKTLFIGQVLQGAFDQEVAALVKQASPITLAGVQGLAVNCTPKYASELGGLLAQQEDVAFGCTYCYSGADKKWWYSLRSRADFDVSEIAKHYGGGGHATAAGFSSTQLVGYFE